MESATSDRYDRSLSLSMSPSVMATSCAEGFWNFGPNSSSPAVRATAKMSTQMSEPISDLCPTRFSSFLPQFVQYVALFGHLAPQFLQRIENLPLSPSR